MFSTLFTMGFFDLLATVEGGTKCLPLKIFETKNDLSMKIYSYKHVSFVSIVCLFTCLVCVTWCDYDVISMTSPCNLCKVDI